MKNFKNKMAVVSTSAFVLVMMPLMADAAGLDSLITNIGKWVGSLVPIVMSIGVLGFFWGLAKFLFGGAEDKTKGVDIMVMGVLSVFIMASLGGIVSFLQKSTGTQNSDKSILRAPCVGDCTARGGRIN